MSTQITPFSTTPSRLNPATFSSDRDIRLAEENSRIVQMNAQANENNAAVTTTNSDALSATNSALSATLSSLSAQGSANYQGAWVASRVVNGVVLNGYIAGQTVSDTNGIRWLCKLTHTTSQTAVQGTYWTIAIPYVGAIGNINSPLLDMPLKNSLAMKAGVGSVTFTRASTATYIDRHGILKRAAIDEPRFEKEGYLNEGISTNLLTYSEDFSISWATSMCTVTANSIDITDPYGTNVADKIKVTGNDPYIVRNDASRDKTVTYSVWIYKNPSNTGSPYMEFYSWRDLSSSNEVAFSGKILLLSGWNRYSFTRSFVTTPSNITTRLDFSEGSLGINGDIFYVFGAQLEPLPFASSYMPTVASAVSRAADRLKVTGIGNIGLGWHSKTISVDSKALGVKEDSRIFDIENFNYNMIRYGAVGTRIEAFYSAGAILAPTDIKQKHRIAYVLGLDNIVSNDLSVYLDGMHIQTNTNTIFNVNSNAPAYIHIGESAGGTEVCFAHITDFRIYDKALTAQEVALA
ncbi:MAG: LamG-like jellyroll fold domain-containing protein [Sulfuricurvum sp.]|nr:LamG-like jellyroll fold domain-containing protein [Sulfuricurvum sp.]